MVSFFDSFLTISNSAVMIASNLLFQSTIILTAGLVIAYLFRKNGASTQSVILRIFFLGIFICPIYSLFLNNAGLKGITFSIPYKTVQTPQHLITNINKDINSPVQKADKNNLSIKSRFNDTLGYSFSGVKTFLRKTWQGFNCLGYASVLYILFTVFWGISAFIILLKLLSVFLYLIYICITAKKAAPSVRKEVDRISETLGIKSPVVLQGNFSGSPFVAFFLKPVLFIPEGIEPDKSILIHEIAHIVRKDCLWKFLCNIGFVIMPFQPLIKLISSKIDILSDYACDDYVVINNCEPDKYAAKILDIAEKFRGNLIFLISRFVNYTIKSTFRRRIERILSHQENIIIKTRKRNIFEIIFVSFIVYTVICYVNFECKVPFIPVQNSIVLQKEAAYYTSSLKAVYKNQKVSVKEENDNPTIKELTFDKTNKTIKTEISTKKLPDNTNKSMSESVATIAVDNTAENPESKPDVVSVSENKPAKTDSIQFKTENLKEKETVALVFPDQIPEQLTDEEIKELKNYKTSMKIGKKFYESGKYFKAVTAFHKALSFSPKNADANNLLGKSYFHVHDYDKAEMFFKIAIAIQRDFADAYYNLGDVQKVKGNISAAMDNYKVAINLNPAYQNFKREFY
jgi:beta-lactamase regulating signal transducer with metallopeptidase domain/TolA-binding protein